VFYITGDNKVDVINITSNSGQIQGVAYPNQLLGAPEGSSYKGILFFQDRTSAAHRGDSATGGRLMQGGGGMQITGTIYLTNTEFTMRTGDGSHFQSLSLQGNSGSATTLTGQIIVDQLSLGGGVGINMRLSALSVLIVRKVALVR
jgi:hypothetical protein